MVGKWFDKLGKICIETERFQILLSKM